MKQLKILCIHGIGGQDSTFNETRGWGKDWRDAFKEALRISNDAHVRFMKFDSFFDGYDADVIDYTRIFTHAFLRKKREKSFIKRWFDNYPDMVAEFLLEDQLKTDLRAELKKELSFHQPDIVYAHSLGSLMCYDFFSQHENSTGHEDLTLITSGSQLGNKYLQKFIASPVHALNLKFWYNFTNPHDLVFAKSELNIVSDKFLQVDTAFKGDLGHNALEYINHPNSKGIWAEIVR